MPLASPTIAVAINQTIMMALAMVVIASMIGALRQPVLNISNQYFHAWPVQRSGDRDRHCHHFRSH